MGDPSPPKSVVPNPKCTLAPPGEPFRNASITASPSPDLMKCGRLGIHNFKISLGDSKVLPAVTLIQWFWGLFSNQTFSSSKAYKEQLTRAQV